MSVQLIHRRHTRLPGGVHVTMLHTRGVPAAALRQMLFSAQLYILAGPLTASPGHWGSYVGISECVGAKIRCSTSLNTWAVRRQAIHPERIMLVTRPHRPLPMDALLLLEASIGRQLSLVHTSLNTRLAAGLAYERSTRSQRLFAQELTERLMRLVQGTALWGQPGGPPGATVREQLIRLLHEHDDALDIDELVGLARSRGIRLASTWPDQQVRRDLTTRERRQAVGCPRALTFPVAGRCVVYPAGKMRLREARASYLARVTSGQHKRPGAAALARRRDRNHPAATADASRRPTPPSAVSEPESRCTTGHGSGKATPGKAA